MRVGFHGSNAGSHFDNRKFTYGNHWRQHVIPAVTIAIRPLHARAQRTECPSHLDTTSATMTTIFYAMCSQSYSNVTFAFESTLRFALNFNIRHVYLPQSERIYVIITCHQWEKSRLTSRKSSHIVATKLDYCIYGDANANPKHRILCGCITIDTH